jgi:hypothetical protein
MDEALRRAIDDAGWSPPAAIEPMRRRRRWTALRTWAFDGTEWTLWEAVLEHQRRRRSKVELERQEDVRPRALCMVTYDAGTGQLRTVMWAEIVP